MAEYIEREALSKKIRESDDLPHMKLYADTWLYCVEAADVVERKRGEWVLGHVEPGYCTPGGNRPWICSECGRVVSWRLDKPNENFCPNCGADMRGAE